MAKRAVAGKVWVWGGSLGFDSTFSAYCVVALSPMDILRLCFLMYELVIIILLVLMCYKYPQLSFRRAAM